MHSISKHLGISALLIALALLLVWIALSQSNSGLPAKAMKQVEAQIAKSRTPSPAPVEPTLKQAQVKQVEEPASAIPSTNTFYRWTDQNGNSGYSKELPANVSSFKAIVLDGKNASL